MKSIGNRSLLWLEFNGCLRPFQVTLNHADNYLTNQSMDSQLYPIFCRIFVFFGTTLSFRLNDWLIDWFSLLKHRRTWLAAILPKRCRWLSRNSPKFSANQRAWFCIITCVIILNTIRHSLFGFLLFLCI